MRTTRKTSTGWSLWSQENHRLISPWGKKNASQGNTSDSSGLLKAIILGLNVRASFMCAKERKCYVWGKQQYYVNQIKSSLLAASMAPTWLPIHLASHPLCPNLRLFPDCAQTWRRKDLHHGLNRTSHSKSTEWGIIVALLSSRTVMNIEIIYVK